MAPPAVPVRSKAMAPTPPRARPPRRRATHFFVPRSHRLFVLADDDGVAAGALADLPAEVAADTWRFSGAEGVAELDPDLIGGPARLASWLFSHNVEFLRGLARAVASGQVVLAAPARSLRAADTAAAALRRPGLQVLAYTSHWNFVPVTP